MPMKNSGHSDNHEHKTHLNQDTQMQAKDEIYRTRDVMERYKISRSTLQFWRTPKRMPKSFSRPFPRPTIPGSPDRWRLSDIVKWENEVNSSPADDQSPSPDDHATP